MPGESLELIQALSRIGTPTLSNAVEQLNVGLSKYLGNWPGGCSMPG